MTAIAPTPAPTPAPASTPASAPAARSARPGPLRRYRWGLVVAACLVLAIGTALWAGGDTEEYPAAFDPRNTGPDGAQALAKVLEDEGVDVTIARSADALTAARVDDATTVLVTSADQLAPTTIEHLLDETSGSDLVLADPPGYVIDEIDDLGTWPVSDVDDVAAGCDLAGLSEDLELSVDGATAYLTPGCFANEEGRGHLLATGASGATYFGAPEALTNDQVLRGDNAAVALRMLGQHERLVWYVPTLDDAVGGEAVSLSALVPEWIAPSLWMGGLALVGLVLWRYRRLGPLSTEPLPVVVRAVETARSRGRMYRKGGDRAHAAAALRAATRRRLAERLALGRQADETAVIDAVAVRMSTTREAVATRLSSTGPVPETDDQLVHLAQELDRLMREVPRG